MNGGGRRSNRELIQRLRQLEGRPYGAYKSLKGRYDFGDFELCLDHVQGDPFAAPSHVRVLLPASTAQFPQWCWETPPRRTGLADMLLREFADECREVSARRGSGKSGLITVDSPSQAVLNRTAMRVNEGAIEARFLVGLPARGRRIDGRQAAQIFADAIPQLVSATLCGDCYDEAILREHVQTIEDSDALRQALDQHGLVAFVPDGAVLPRRSGVDERPLLRDPEPFASPDSLSVTLHRPHGGAVKGLGIPRGVTLIVGGGYHGKSTLLKALEQGVYGHIPGDGREFVVCDETAVKVRAEDGRSVVGNDISPFINDLPKGGSTQHFSTENASGSTSQAANIVEALEVGARVLLIDEDTAAHQFHDSRPADAGAGGEGKRADYPAAGQGASALRRTRGLHRAGHGREW